MSTAAATTAAATTAAATTAAATTAAAEDFHAVFRRKIQKKLDEKLHNLKHSENLEKGIFNYALQEADKRKVVKKWDNRHFMQLYKDRARSIYFNLNESIVAKIASGEIKPHIVAFMTHQELNPTKWATLIAEKVQRDANKFEMNLVAATDTFTCRKCKSKKCTYYQMQTRSADEPMTTFVTCCECGTRWKC